LNGANFEQDDHESLPSKENNSKKDDSFLPKGMVIKIEAVGEMEVKQIVLRLHKNYFTNLKAMYVLILSSLGLCSISCIIASEM